MSRRPDPEPLPPELERLGAELQAATTRDADGDRRRRRRHRGLATVVIAGVLAAIVVPAQLGPSVHISTASDETLLALSVPSTLSVANSCVQPRNGGVSAPAGRCVWRDALGDPVQAAAILSVRPN